MEARKALSLNSNLLNKRGKMPLQTQQPFWRYAIFQIFAGFTLLFLLLALLTSYFSLFPPSVSVQLSLDLSSSTYESTGTQLFNGSGTIMEQELQAVKAYVERNQELPKPNLLSVSGFANQVVPITNQFSSDKQQINQAIDQEVQPNLADKIGGGTNMDLAVEDGLSQLRSQTLRCKQILVITDGVFELDQGKIDAAKQQNVKLNFLIAGQPVAPAVNTWAQQTGGIALSATPDNISQLLSGQIFNRFNSNPLTPLFYALAWICAMWMLLLPLERIMFKYLKIRIDYAGKIALYNAIFWTIFTPITLYLIGINPLDKC
jgi:Ca-activated chloride channel family protein